MPKKENKSGRKSLYHEMVEPYLENISGMALEGATEKEIYNKLGVSHDTFIKYKKIHPELVESLKKGKEIADFRVEAALYKRAIGYDYIEITEECDSAGNITKTKTVTKHVFGDVGAQAFWLKNRKPKQWVEARKQVENDQEKKIVELLNKWGVVNDR